MIPATDQGIDAWLEQALNLERTPAYREFKLDRILAVLPLLPTPPAPCTITGTKGKGSTLRLMESALLADGQHTLSFTSPHLTSVRERWRIDGVPAPATVIATHCGTVAALERTSGISLTYFERCFAIAVLCASARPTARFLCEVGLGGRLDCANALDAAVVVLTHVSRDHCNFLGNTLRSIAHEKLALCRPGRPLVIAPQSAEGLAAVRSEVPAAAVPVWAQRPTSPFVLALPGDHQHDNAATAWAALRCFAPEVSEATARRGFAQARLAGRCQLIIHGDKRLLVDGAHNGVSIAATLAVASAQLRPGWRLLLGIAKDKDIDEILATVPPGLSVTRVAYPSPRARMQADWPTNAQAWPFHADIAAAIASQPRDCDLCITGSLYLAAAALITLGAAGELPG